MNTITVNKTLERFGLVRALPCSPRLVRLRTFKLPRWQSCVSPCYQGWFLPQRWRRRPKCMAHPAAGMLLDGV